MKKKMMIVLMLVMMIFGTVGCGADEPAPLKNIYSYDEELGETVYYDADGVKWTQDNWNEIHEKHNGTNQYFGFNQ